MKEQVPAQSLHVRLMAASLKEPEEALEGDARVSAYPLKAGLGFTGQLFVAPPNQSPPRWLSFIDTGLASPLGKLTNRTNAAVLILKRKKRFFALTFGHGRHLLRPAALVADFGLRAALNGLRADSLRSLDSMALEEQVVHRRTQSGRGSRLDVFGVDVARDILRGVTGAPRQGVPFPTIAGNEAALKVAAKVTFNDLGPMCDTLLDLYGRSDYKQQFAWVDNVRRVLDPLAVAKLDKLLLSRIQEGTDGSVYLAPPNLVTPGSIDGFGYSGQRKRVESDMSLDHYIEGVTVKDLTVDDLKSSNVLVYKESSSRASERWPIYRCLVAELDDGGKRFVLASGEWFELDKLFADRIRGKCQAIPASKVVLPDVGVRANGKLETEPSYNVRVGVADRTMAVLDGKTCRCETAADGIEPCDLLSAQGHMIHVKHRSGGSSSLSHMFAQGRIASEALLADSTFRMDLRAKLRALKPSWEKRIPKDKPSPADFPIIFAVLGGDPKNPGTDLPFFSQVNLARTYEGLTAMGMRVEIVGIPVENSNRSKGTKKPARKKR